MVPGGVKAVALLFPCSGIIGSKRKEEDGKIRTKGQEPIDPSVFWMKQTVRVCLVCPLSSPNGVVADAKHRQKDLERLRNDGLDPQFGKCQCHGDFFLPLP
jgi:hypothetical protein